MLQSSKIYVAGHLGMVGSAIVRKLQAEGYLNIVKRSSKELDLTNQQEVNRFFAAEKPEYVFVAAAKVGGIIANNTYKAEFLYDNLMIQSNVIHAAYKNGVNKLLFLGSSCIYPKLAPQPIKEEDLLSGYLEPTNEAYAIAKIAGIKMCEAYRDQYGSNFISAMPTNLYGPNDNYDSENSHVLPALIRKFSEAKLNNQSQVEIWGTGNPKRDFLHVDDLAAAGLFLMKVYDKKEFLNIGTGEDITIKDLALMIKDIVAFEGDICFNTSKPDGTPRKLMDISKIKQLGWTHRIGLREGIKNTFTDYIRSLNK